VDCGRYTYCALIKTYCTPAVTEPLNSPIDSDGRGIGLDCVVFYTSPKVVAYSIYRAERHRRRRYRDRVVQHG